MKTIYILVFIVIVFSCSEEDTALIATPVADSQVENVPVGVLTGKWKLIKYYDLTRGTIESEPNDIKRSVIIDFSDNGSQGKMSGQTVANSVGGDYELLKKYKMKTLIFYGTKVWEPYWGDKFWDAIWSASSYERQSKKLFIYFNNDTEKIEFDKQ